MPVGYKLFRIKNEKLYPLYVYANTSLEMNKWLKAKCGVMLENGKVKSRLGPLAYRPGWHINDKVPYVEHIYSVHNGQKFQKEGTVWAEVEYSDSVNYQGEADKAGMNKKGKVIGRNAFLKKVPENGCYRYKTSPSMYGEWIIAGEMKIIRILSDEEVIELCHKEGLEPLPRYSEK